MCIISTIDPEGVRESGNSSGPGQAGRTGHSHLIPGHHAGLGSQDKLQNILHRVHSWLGRHSSSCP